MNYGELKTEITDWLGDGQFAAKVERMIELAEAEINRRLDTMDMEAIATATANNDEYLALPADFGGVKSARLITTEGHEFPLRYITDTHMSEFPEPEKDYLTRFMTIVDGQFRFYPKLDDETVEIRYSKRVPALSTSNTTNWLLNAHPDVYIYGSLAQAGAFADASKVSAWRAQFENAMHQVVSYDVRKRFSGPMPQMRPHRVAGD